MLLLDSQNIGYTWDLVGNGSSSSGLPWSPHFAPPSHTKDSRYGPRSIKEHQGCGFLWAPWPLEIPWWLPPLGISALWVGIEGNSWLVSTPLVPPMMTVFRRWIHLVSQHLLLAPSRCTRGHWCCYGSSHKDEWQSNVICFFYGVRIMTEGICMTGF